MTKERMKEILVNVVNYVAVVNNTSGQIEELLKYGFEAPELAEFGYSKADIEAVTGESCEINNEEEPKELETGAFVLTAHYSFDSDMPVWMFKTEEEARAELERQFLEELRIQTKENGHVLGEDIETDYNGSGTWASITIFCKDENDVMEWKVSQARTDKGIGSEIPVPAKDDFMNPPVSSDNEVVRLSDDILITEMEKRGYKVIKADSFNTLGEGIAELIEKNGLNASECNDVFSAIKQQPEILGGKIWTIYDIDVALEKYFADGFDLTEEQKRKIAAKMNKTVFGTEDDSEWFAIRDAIKDSDFCVELSGIKWDVDKEDFDNEAEYEAVMENNLPETIKIPISQLYGFGSVDDYISNEYDYCIKSIGSIDVISTKYQLTDAGRKKCERYIAELKAKRKEILDAGLDTADNTPVPTVQDIEDDLNFTGLIDETEYLNTFGATDNYDADNAVSLILGEDFVEVRS